MESDVTQPALIDKLWVWGEAHKKQIVIGLVVALVVGLVVALLFTFQNQKQTNANDALSKLASRAASPSAPGPDADALLKVAADFPGTDAAQRAILLAASDLFANGKYDESRAQFQRFLQEHGDSPFAGQAALGIAATLDAQGKAQDAINAYLGVVDHYQQNWNVGPQAKLALARLFIAQGKLQDARGQLMDLANPRVYPNEIASEANMRLRELFTAHPELIPASPAPAQTLSPILENPNRSVPSAPVSTSTNRPAATPPAGITKPATNKP
jgi:predicted negative regulator of RcsB-dependent stress response